MDWFYLQEYFLYVSVRVLSDLKSHGKSSDHVRLYVVLSNELPSIRERKEPPPSKLFTSATALWPL